jgi:hypothetical protein
VIGGESDALRSPSFPFVSSEKETEEAKDARDMCVPRRRARSRHHGRARALPFYPAPASSGRGGLVWPARRRKRESTRRGDGSVLSFGCLRPVVEARLQEIQMQNPDVGQHQSFGVR